MSLLPRYRTVLDAAVLLGVAERTVRRLVVTGQARACRRGTQPWRVSVEDLENAMREAACRAGSG